MKNAAGNRGFWWVRDLPAVLWLTTLVAVVVAHSSVPAPRWLMVHLLLLGAATHSIMVWGKHFADALLHSAPRRNDRLHQSIRLGLLNIGVVLVLTGVVTDHWKVASVGAAAVVTAVGWHGLALVRQLRRSLPARFGTTVRYYVAASALLPVGVLLGVWMARGLAAPFHDRVVMAHVVVNLLGWVGLTILGTLLTLWPTMLRTRIADGAERAAGRALPVLVVAILVAASGALVGSRIAVVAGLLGYLAGVGILLRPFVNVARNKPPASYPTWSVLAGLCWLLGGITALAVSTATAPDWDAVGDRLDWAAVPLAAGFVAQVLLGALSYLLPVALGGGPSSARAANAVLDRAGVLRITLVNAGLVVWVFPLTGLARALIGILVLGGLASFLPLMFLAFRASREARAAARTADPAEQPAPTRVEGGRPPGQVAGLVAVGLAAVALSAAVGVAVDPAALAGSGTSRAADAGVAATGRTTRVAVTAAHMRFSPAIVNVPAGNRLVIELENTDHGDVHDLVLDSGDDSGQLSPGDSKRMDVGVVGRDMEGWCSVVGHRQMGMVFHVHALGAPPAGVHMSSERASAADDLDFVADPDPGFIAHNPVLPPLEERRVHRRTFTVRELERHVAPGVTQRLWTYDGSAPGPILHGRIGDRFVIRLVNHGTMGHSIDFHAGSVAPDRAMRTIAPGKSLVYRFTATRAGIWMYHCSSMPMSAHIANGLFGAVVIDPPNLPPVDHSYLLIQSELYLGPEGGTVDVDKVRAEEPDAVVFNGYPNQYDHRPLAAKVGERVRVWVLDAGPDRSTSFHVVGGQFDTVYSEGAYLLRPGHGGSQSLALSPGQGGFVELTFPEAGHYRFVSHVMVDAERGAEGLFEVTR